MIYQFKSEHFLPIDINKAWTFFSSAKNLALITPSEMDFQIKTQLDDREIYEGMLINYTVKPLLGIPLAWETEIFDVRMPYQFSDRQRKGPYKMWEHTHTFIENESGVLMLDEVNYQLPFGVLGNLAHALFIKRKVESIFTYRKQALNRIFTSN